MPYRSAIGKQQHSNLNFLERALKAHTPPFTFFMCPGATYFGCTLQ